MRTIKNFSILFAILFLSACSGQSTFYLENEGHSLCEYEVIAADYAEEEETEGDTSKAEVFIVKTAEKWQKAYAELLRAYITKPLPHGDEYFQGFFRHFILYDIDKNGIPELIITYIAAGINGESIYTFVDGEITQLKFRDGFFAYFNVMARPNNTPGIIIFAYGDVTLMQIDETGMFAEMHLRGPFLEDDDCRWYINSVEVTEEEHNEKAKFIMAGRDMFSWYTHYHYHLWPYELTEANIESIILGIQ